MRILKFQLHPRLFDQTVNMPEGAQIVHVDCQSGIPCIWAKCDTHAPSKPRHFCVYGTGWDVEEDIDLEYIGTCQGTLNEVDQSGVQSQVLVVWHVFEYTP